MRILVVEDEAAMARSLERGLKAEGYTVEVAGDGDSGLDQALNGAFDAIILDLMLPKRSGYDVVSELRVAGVAVPVLMLTAKQGEFDQTESLDSGADDFLSKPFSYPVLLARLRALIRRGGAPTGAVLEYGDLRFDTASHRCWRAGTEVGLTRREQSLLTYLMHRTEQAVSKSELLDHVWDPSTERDPNVVEVYIGYLRRKLDQPGRPSHVETVRSFGYRIVAVEPTDELEPVDERAPVDELEPVDERAPVDEEALEDERKRAEVRGAADDLGAPEDRGAADDREAADESERA